MRIEFEQGVPSKADLADLLAQWRAVTIPAKMKYAWMLAVRVRWSTYAAATRDLEQPFQDLNHDEVADLLDKGHAPARQCEAAQLDDVRAYDQAMVQMLQLWDDEEPLTIDHLHAAHRTMMDLRFDNGIENDDWPLGAFKTKPTAAGAAYTMAECAHPAVVPALMDEIVRRANVRVAAMLRSPGQFDPSWAIAALHYELIAIQPYADGNHRIAIWLDNWMCMAAGYPPLVIHENRYDEYLRALSAMKSFALPDDSQVDLPTVRQMAISAIDIQPLRDFYALRLAESLAFSTAIAGGNAVALIDGGHAAELEHDLGGPP
ncbi:MAG: hypothetical protein F4Y08_10995 [Caldilineaceae bacterium SB0662_bin_9]|uniref:Fido domain-containing protein n=1 Tax=Caldilineaceae bacterium SB0662_bin_9 TaxID=2605258 RepID=A0A6B1DVP8_9CHLR|nr:Fic family protein [Caldilineaceae bacterium]MXZ40324.1 hypothetical protein [Caldilineaceae bacterium SB0666_bin_21]MYD90845.1 hypothetical protein [Caldilineaceae bacterium SB0662_bin_9]